MAEYIEREALLESMEARFRDLVNIYGTNDQYTRGFDSGIVAVEDAPAADVMEVKHGRWIGDWYFGNPFVCSYCGHEGCYSGEFNDKQYYYTNYCPNCGAKMDLGVDNA